MSVLTFVLLTMMGLRGERVDRDGGCRKAREALRRKAIRQRRKDVESRQARLRRPGDKEKGRVGWRDNLRGECHRYLSQSHPSSFEGQFAIEQLFVFL